MKPLILRNEPTKAAGVAAVSGGFIHCGAPASAMESELLMYKQKMDQMTALIRHYQSELESQKMRRDGMETVSRLLAESRQENAALKKQQAASQMLVKNLQNKLTSYGILPSIENGDNEVIIPGTSKQTLTNLALENKRLRSLLLQENGSDSSEVFHKIAEDPNTEKSLQQSVNQLETENQSMKRKLSDLEDLFKSSNNEKDRQLIQCHEEIQRLTKQKGETITVQKTEIELSALKDHLKALMTECANFESHLENVQDPDPGKKGPAIELVPVAKQAVERTDSVDGAEVHQLQAEKQKLQAKVEEVTQMNQRWQEFFSERDRYTKTLEQRVQDLEARLKTAMHSGSTPEVNHHMGQVVEKSQKKIEHLEVLKKKAEEQVEWLRQEVAVRDAQLSQLHIQVTTLKQAAQSPSSSETHSMIEHLKAQIQVCTEDFEKERQDRQIALQKVNSLQEQNTHLQKLNGHLQTLLNQTQRPVVQEQSHFDTTSLLHHSRAPCAQSLLAFDSPSDSPNRSENCQDYPDFHYDNSNNREPLFQAPGPVSLPVPTPTMDLLSRGLEKPRHSLSDPALASEASKKDTFLTCPKCNKEFSEERQGELLAHMDVCWE